MKKKSGIYTKGGDQGETSLIGGKRVPKFHPRIEAYGSVDELMAHTALLRDMVTDEIIKKELLKILSLEMSTASLLAADCLDCPVQLPELTEQDVVFLEERIDDMDAGLKPLKGFIIPGGNPVVSQAHVVRTVCRRTERSILRLAGKQEDIGLIIIFYNRLSDYFFVLSRKLAVISGIDQLPWKPGVA
ncbi:MAG: cob(I)yrinic acid a,c-diamide adenosyltransferase [Bacteroidales bacterium]|nr:cob(I)yrinic acid a,c-diamide adenosyltransferase [Bacteroidales bacterium]MBN2699522.1 cob(I)yrinic acid a,c-diamide adenosyltransferase [Bacteroidales bacterium]